MAVSDWCKWWLLIDQKTTKHNSQPSNTPITRSGQPLCSVKVCGDLLWYLIFIIWRSSKSRCRKTRKSWTSKPTPKKTTGTPSHFLKSQLLRPILENDSLFRLPKGNSRNFILPKVLQTLVETRFYENIKDKPKWNFDKHRNANWIN